MSDDRDEYIEIELDDDEGAAAPGDVLEVTLDGPDEPEPRMAASSGSAAVPPPARPRRPARPPGPSTPAGVGATREPPLPMTAGGVCQRCGYALRPLEEACPRCGRRVDEPVENPVEKVASLPSPATQEPFPAPEAALAPPQRSYWLFTLAAAIVFLALAVGVPLYLWMQPAQRAGREYREGLRAQLRQDFEGARAHYRRALELDPNMALAAFALGTTHLRIGSPSATAEIQRITEQAIQGQTQALDEADRWFREALRVGESLPPATRLMDERISTPTRLRAFCHMCLGLTALVRYSAALQAEQYDDAAAWMGVAGEEWSRAAGADPADSQMRQILGNPPGTQGGAGGGLGPGLGPQDGAEPGDAPPGAAPGFGPGWGSP